MWVHNSKFSKFQDKTWLMLWLLNMFTVRFFLSLEVWLLCQRFTMYWCKTSHVRWNIPKVHENYLLLSDEPKKIFIAFSLYTNVPEMLKLETKSTRSIECFHGLKALAAFWVIAGHRIFRQDRMVSRPVQIENLFSEIVFAVFMTNSYAVDTFFLMSGTLVTQSCLRSLDA